MVPSSIRCTSTQLNITYSTAAIDTSPRSNGKEEEWRSERLDSSIWAGPLRKRYWRVELSARKEREIAFASQYREVFGWILAGMDSWSIAVGLGRLCMAHTLAGSTRCAAPAWDCGLGAELVFGGVSYLAPAASVSHATSIPLNTSPLIATPVQYVFYASFCSGPY